MTLEENYVDGGFGGARPFYPEKTQPGEAPESSPSLIESLVDQFVVKTIQFIDPANPYLKQYLDQKKYICRLATLFQSFEDFKKKEKIS